VLGFDDYATQTRDWFAETRRLGIRLDIEFRMTQRLIGDDAASERGEFTIRSERPTGERREITGRFHTFSRRRADGWRIVADYDGAD
jgi:ketosteroid isomerase-like protein